MFLGEDLPPLGLGRKAKSLGQIHALIVRKVRWKGSKTQNVKPEQCQQSVLPLVVLSLADRLGSPAEQRLRTAVNGRGRRPSGGGKELEQLMEPQQKAQVSN